MALNAAPASIPAMVQQRIAAHAAATILRKKDRGIWRSVTWAEFGERMRSVSLALWMTGLRRGDTVGILADTCPEWVFADLGILAAGGVRVGIPTECTPDRLEQLLRDTACHVLFVANEEHLDKALEARAACPSLQRIIIFDMKGLREFADEGCEDFAGFMARGAHADATAWSTGIASITASDPAVLEVPADSAQPMRTLSHGDLLQAVADARTLLQPRAGDERVALLPLTEHVELACGLYSALDGGTISNFLENADTGLENLQEVQPTLLTTDMALWRTLYTRINNAAEAATPVQRWLYRWAIAAARRRGFVSTLAHMLVLHQVRRELGLARLRLAVAGDALLPPEIADWVSALGIKFRLVEVSHAAAGTMERGAMTVEA